MARDKDADYKLMFDMLVRIHAAVRFDVRTTDEMYHEDCIAVVDDGWPKETGELVLAILSGKTGNPFIDAMGPDSFADNSKWAGACGYTPSI